MIRPNVETFIGCESSFEEASVVLYGAPFDSTTSFRPGARFGPSAMRHESFGLETYSPYQDRDLMDPGHLPDDIFCLQIQTTSSLQQMWGYVPDKHG